MKTLKGVVQAFTIAIWAYGCVSCPIVDPQFETISHLDDYLIPLSKAVDVIADRLPPDAKDKKILETARDRSGNPKLLEPFGNYLIEARIQEGVGVILVCSKDGKEGIIEDVSCTTRPDSYRPSGSPCAYLLDVKAVCEAP